MGSIERAAVLHERTHAEVTSSEGIHRCGLTGEQICARFVKGEHPLMRQLRARIVRQAEGGGPVLFEGETGTGKRMAALALHHAGPRHGRPLILASLGSQPASLAQSDLFGHKKGAFTGADRDRHGLFIQARGSTLLLDDIADYAPDLQAMILNAVEYGLVRPVGADLEETSDARIVATTNRPLHAEVKEGKFREDLYYRISGGTIRIPPLRDHLSDLSIYVGDFLLGHADPRGPRTVSDGALNVLCEHRWPGNVRELHNVLSRTIQDTESRVLLGEDVRAQLGDVPASPAVESAQGVMTAEGARIRSALEASHWNVSRAAKLLGFGRTKMYQIMAKHGIAR
jgi:DNA-binding NtrC family response regulator